MRLDGILAEAMAERGAAGRPALIEPGLPPLTYEALRQRMVDAAQALAGWGLRPGERMAVVAENTVDAVVLLLAAVRTGAWIVPLNPRLSAGEIDAVLAHCQPRLVAFGAQASPEAAAHAQRLGAVDTVLDGLARPVGLLSLQTGTAPLHPPTGADDDVALMLYTSGSTGLPKGVMLTHANLDFVTRTSVAQGALQPGDRVFDALPMSHSFGLVSTLLCALRAGATVQLVPRFSAEALAEALLADGITVLHGVPAMYARLQEWALQGGPALRPNRLRLAYIGGSQIDPVRKAQAEALLGLALHHGYGLTECAPAATRTIGRAPPKAATRITAGWPIPGVQVELRDAQGQPVPPGGHGEVWIRGPNVMKGYFRDAEQTARAVDADGWLHSGDIGEFGPDGDLAIVGRQKEMIIRSGFNVYPAEVERAIAAFPGVAQSAVVGRPVEGDEEVVAFVEPMDGRPIDTGALRSFLREHLAPYKLPSRIVCLPRLPAAATGKVLKAQLRAMAAEGLPS